MGNTCPRIAPDVQINSAVAALASEALLQESRSHCSWLSYPEGTRVFVDSSCFWYAGDIGVAVAGQENLPYVLVLAHWSRYPVALYSATNTAACSKQAGCGGREHVVLPRRLVRLGGDQKDKKK